MYEERSRNQSITSMASRGLLQLMSYFTLSISLLLLIFALSSHQATASSSSSSTESIATTFETGRSTLSLPWDKLNLPKNKSLGDIWSILNKIRHKIIDEMLKIIGLPPSGDILNYLLKAVKWLADKISIFISNPRALHDTVLNWIVDSVMNPFRTLKDGMLSFRRLFRYLHRLKKGTFIDFGKDNPVYKCYLEAHQKCLSQFKPYEQTLAATLFYCAWIFYERCQLHYYWENGMWKVPRINGGDTCKVKKCANQPPI